MWQRHYSSSKQFVTYQEFCRETIEKILSRFKIVVEARPSRSSLKNENEERNYNVFKGNGSYRSRRIRCFMSDDFIQSSIFNQSAQRIKQAQCVPVFARLLPFGFEIYTIAIHQNILDTCWELMKVWALQKASRTIPAQTSYATVPLKETRTWIYYEISEQNDTKRWVEAKVTSSDNPPCEVS